MVKVDLGGSCSAGILADAEIKERLDILRKKSANVVKPAIARWLLKVAYHVLKERRPHITAYKTAKVGAAF